MPVSSNKAKNISREQFLDNAGLLLDRTSKQNIQYFKTYKSEYGLVVFKGENLVCDYEYAKQVVTINELLTYKDLLEKYIKKSNKKVSEYDNKLISADNFRILIDKYLKDVYAKKLDTDEFDKLAQNLVKFLQENVKTETKTIPVFNYTKTKVVDVTPTNHQILSEIKKFNEFNEYIAHMEKEIKRA